MSITMYHLLVGITGVIMIFALVVACGIVMQQINKVRSHKPPLIIAFFGLILLIVFVVIITLNIWNI